MRSRIRLGAPPPITTWSTPDCGAVAGGIAKDKEVSCRVLVAGWRFESACSLQARCCRWPPRPALARAHIAPARPPHALRAMAWPLRTPRNMRDRPRRVPSARLPGARAHVARHARSGIVLPAGRARRSAGRWRASRGDPARGPARVSPSPMGLLSCRYLAAWAAARRWGAPALARRVRLNLRASQGPRPRRSNRRANRRQR